MLKPEEQILYDFLKERENTVKYYDIENYAKARGINSPYNVLQRLAELGKVDVILVRGRTGQKLYRAR